MSETERDELESQRFQSLSNPIKCGLDFSVSFDIETTNTHIRTKYASIQIPLACLREVAFALVHFEQQLTLLGLTS